MIRPLAYLFFAFTSLTASYAYATEMRMIVGWVEKVHIDSANATFSGKLDTGAKTSSVDADIIKLIKPKTESETDFGSVVFSITDEAGKASVLKRKIHRWVRIKKKEGGFLRRPVVSMSFCIANTLVTEEVNLSRRDHFIYPVLIGRNMLEEGHLVVDASRTFTSKPRCQKKS